MAPAQWSTGKKLAVCGIMFMSLLLFALFCMPSEDEQDDTAALRIGAGEDITGVLLDEICRCAAEDGDTEMIGSSIFVDCCSSSAQWALQANDIDVGFLCSSAALRMVNGDNDFEIYGPVLMNSEVLAYKKGTDKIQSASIPLKRNFFDDIIRKTYPEIQTVTELNRNYALFTLMAGDTDAAVIDVSDAFRAGGDIAFLPVSDKEYISYCLVVRKDIIGTRVFEHFLDYYAMAAERLNNVDARMDTMGMDKAFWDMCGTEFLNLA